MSENPQDRAREWVEQWAGGLERPPRLILTRGEGPHLAALAERFHQAAVVSWVTNDYMLPRSANLLRLPSHLEFIANTVRNALALGLEVSAACVPEEMIIKGSAGPPLEGPLAEWREQAALEHHTLGTLGGLWGENLVANMPSVVRSAAISDLPNLLAGCPVIVAAGGPSLDQLLPELIECRERVILLAVNRAVARLFQAGLVPDGIVVLEARDQSESIEGVPREALESAVLFHSAYTHPAHLNWAPRQKVVFHGPASRWLMPWHGGPSYLPSGGNVGTATLYLAWMLGGWPVLTTGLDLCLSGDLSPENLVAVPGWQGQPRLATPVMADYIGQLESLIAEIRQREPRAKFSALIPAGATAPPGARIAGMDALPWSLLGKQLPPRPIASLEESARNLLQDQPPHRDREVLTEVFARFRVQLEALAADPLGPAGALALNPGLEAARALIGARVIASVRASESRDQEREIVASALEQLEQMERQCQD